MTGYGRGEYKDGGVELCVEVKTVNNRYLDVAVRAPRIFIAFEDVIRSAVREKLTRGHADVFVSFSDKRRKERTIYLDEGAAQAYAEAARKIHSLFPDAENDFSVTNILRFPDVISQDEVSSADEECLNALKTALSSALDNLNAMRSAEGEKLEKDMLSRVDVIDGDVKEIEKRAPAVVENYKSKLDAKIKKILESTEIDEARILTEVALFADKSNIDEEITRLHSHISQFKEICKEKLVGRKLDFLVQEFNRETNTICSKSNDTAITKIALAMKNEIEKIREQVQNVE
ncbi:MAG: YicC family protein [Clostridia bacterium]|nr:YicC family protein [Clostridia bacterium]